ncbi:hypothetical protein ACNJX9_09895 [Bradyrhizobium sp. DASA03076]|uniref:hypothetical protein n=1 Tax=Bradyrhizobium sp. BLXBL-03 TaxID=3395916 RepID=UPI003F71204C
MAALKSQLRLPENFQSIERYQKLAKLLTEEAMLAQRADEFMKAVELDDAANRKRQAKGMIDLASKQDEAPEFAKRLMQFATEIDKKYPKAPVLNQKKIAEDGSMQDVYVLYQVLSSESVHLSAHA